MLSPVGAIVRLALRSKPAPLLGNANEAGMAEAACQPPGLECINHSCTRA